MDLIQSFLINQKAKEKIEPSQFIRIDACFKHPSLIDQNKKKLNHQANSVTMDNFRWETTAKNLNYFLHLVFGMCVAFLLFLSIGPLWSRNERELCSSSTSSMIAIIELKSSRSKLWQTTKKIWFSNRFNQSNNLAIVYLLLTTIKVEEELKSGFNEKKN